MIATALVALSLAAHPLHTTHTEVAERSPGAAVLTIRAFSDDLLRAVQGREAAVDDSAIARYVRTTVELRCPDGRLAPLVWGGMQRDGDVLLITLTARLPIRLSGMSVRQAMHMEMFDDQVNVVQARYGGRSVSLLFFGGDAPRRLP